MKIIKKGWLKNNPGFALVELVVAMTVGSIVMGGVFAIMTQLFWVTADNSNYMAAFRHVQNAGAWISHDALMAQEVTPGDDPGTPDETEFVTLGWTDWSGKKHQVVYTLEGSGDMKDLKRNHYINSRLQDSNLVAQFIDPDPLNTSSIWDENEKELTVTITAKVGDYVLLRHGTYAEPATRTYKVIPRPLS